MCVFLAVSIRAISGMDNRLFREFVIVRKKSPNVRCSNISTIKYRSIDRSIQFQSTTNATWFELKHSQKVNMGHILRASPQNDEDGTSHCFTGEREMLLLIKHSRLVLFGMTFVSGGTRRNISFWWIDITIKIDRNGWIFVITSRAGHRKFERQITNQSQIERWWMASECVQFLFFLPRPAIGRWLRFGWVNVKSRQIKLN